MLRQLGIDVTPYLVKGTQSESNLTNYRGCSALSVREDWLDIVLTHDSRSKLIGCIASMRKQGYTYMPPPKLATPFPVKMKDLLCRKVPRFFAENDPDLSVGSYWSADCYRGAPFRHRNPPCAIP